MFSKGDMGNSYVWKDAELSVDISKMAWGVLTLKQK